ncbi:hypothetical protein [Conexibacter sp. S30A1]|uniref:hypothetical protein n=1 Tax=Conexibacter sp. S30A1 TaxID=2937800 RepID=UPI00200E92E4|nr:hypothetical protein [Conexibacter sp. S30A1]
MQKSRRLSRTAALTYLSIVVLILAAALMVEARSALALTRPLSPQVDAHNISQQATSRQAQSAAALPAEGIFAGCALNNSALTTCEQQLTQLHAAGMQVAVVGMQGDSLAELSAYAAYAQSVGVSLMWQINDPGFWGSAWIGQSAAADWPQFSAACGCTGTSQVLQYMIQWLGALPATYGYYAADDSTLTPSELPGLTQYVAAIRAADPNHMIMVGSSEGQGTTYYSAGATIGNEIYPVTTSSLLPYSNNSATWQAIQQGVQQDARAAAQNGTASAFILQAFTFGDNIWDGEAVGVCTASMSQAQCGSLLQYPSAAVQLELRNEVLQYGHPKLILWFNYNEASQGNRWAALSSVVQAPYPVSASAARARRSQMSRALRRRRHLIRRRMHASRRWRRT